VNVSTSFARRFARRVRARRFSRLRAAMVVLILVFVVVVVSWALLISSLFGVQSVKVAGTDRLSREQVVEAAAIRVGTPLARLDTDAVAGRLRVLPQVSSVSVVRQWPRGVGIVVHERVPAAVRPSGSSYVLLDRAGVPFATVGHRPRRLPVVLAPVEARATALRAALDVLDAVPVRVGRQVRSVRAATPEEVTLVLSRERTVIWGSPERAARKAAVLTALMTRRAAVYDVSAPDTPTTRSR
jgi:cell division protein FtsQ